MSTRRRDRLVACPGQPRRSYTGADARWVRLTTSGPLPFCCPRRAARRASATNRSTAIAPAPGRAAAAPAPGAAQLSLDGHQLESCSAGRGRAQPSRNGGARGTSTTRCRSLASAGGFRSPDLIAKQIDKPEGPSAPRRVHNPLRTRPHPLDRHLSRLLRDVKTNGPALTLDVRLRHRRPVSATKAGRVCREGNSSRPCERNRRLGENGQAGMKLDTLKGNARGVAVVSLVLEPRGLALDGSAAPVDGRLRHQRSSVRLAVAPRDVDDHPAVARL